MKIKKRAKMMAETESTTNTHPKKKWRETCPCPHHTKTLKNVEHTPQTQIQLRQGTIEDRGQRYRGQRHRGQDRDTEHRGTEKISGREKLREDERERGSKR